MIIKNELINDTTKLIIPNPKIHAKETCKWLSGEEGKENMRSMGCLVGDNFRPSVKNEISRLKQMIKSKTEFLLMVEYKGKIVGQLELWTQQLDRVPTPSISIFIGCPLARNKSIGSNILKSAHSILESAGFGMCHSRALLANQQSNYFFQKNGYKKLDPPYYDNLGLAWQNYQYKLQPLQSIIAKPSLSKYSLLAKKLSITSFLRGKRPYNAKY